MLPIPDTRYKLKKASRNETKTGASFLVLTLPNKLELNFFEKGIFKAATGGGGGGVGHSVN